MEEMGILVMQDSDRAQSFLECASECTECADCDCSDCTDPDD